MKTDNLITAGEVVERITEAAEHGTDGSRWINTMRGIRGQYMPLGEAVELVESARLAAWVDNPFDHELFVVPAEGDAIWFNVQRSGGAA